MLLHLNAKHIYNGFICIPHKSVKISYLINKIYRIFMLQVNKQGAYMTIFGGIVTYIVVWWVVLFAVLPWGLGAQTIDSIKDNAPLGSDPGAPKKPHIGLKFLVTTLVSFLIWGFFVLIFYFDIISYRDFL